ncbi:MAG: alpha-glucan family phosphorylase [Anaerolineales bacterium]|nr:alpha-glucan family phosphorylase [Anaerolineales bacterium]
MRRILLTLDQVKEITPNHFSLPRRIERLGELAYNLWWTWNPDVQRLYKRIDSDLWEETTHNPIQFLRKVERAKLNAVTHDSYYLDFYDRSLLAFDQYMEREDTWYQKNHGHIDKEVIAYFSTEFGLHETVPIYAGGLGVLSGDHLKEASDLGLPLVAMGFLYTKGYFTQVISEDGWQEAQYAKLNFDELPVLPLVDNEEKPTTVSVELAGREVLVRMWKIQVGRVPLYLLDSNVDGNSDDDRELTSRLYSSDLDLRISQEIILGIGGVRALRKLGHSPAVWHMNEGHSAFLVLERIREQVEKGTSLEEAKNYVQAKTVFTTHTPVPAGSDEFPAWLIDKYFGGLQQQLGLSRDEFFDLARHTVSWGETFSMPVLAMRTSNLRNGVSELHGEIAREMWGYLWPDVKTDEVPISHITNGIHTGTWLARRMRHLYGRYLGSDWLDNIDDPEIWEAVSNIPDEELWAVRRHLKRKLVIYMRERARAQWGQDEVHPVQVIASGALLNPYALTIGFARRFATYKRADLILSDFERLLGIINKPNMPVQIIFAGKAHPADQPGKLLIQNVYRKVKKAESGGRLVFLEDYDMNLARYLVQGVDVWLNTPRRPNEACGTSGQKAAVNGVLNFSILDGWWREGFNGKNGWAIGTDDSHTDYKFQDDMDAESLYDSLENEIIPLFYDRSSGNLPVDWIGLMKESIRTLAPEFSMRRMLKAYANDLYFEVMDRTK